MSYYQTIVIGGGPAGLAAALAASEGTVLIIEREQKLGGILKQCIHDGFGVIRFKEKLSGTEYAERFIDEVKANNNIQIKIQTFVIEIKKTDRFYVKTTSKDGIMTYQSQNLILANGCRERTPRQIGIHGDRPSGLMTAGTAQNYVNLLGVMPTKRCIILGSGDIGLIMARRLTLEGAEVLGVYEAKNQPSGLTRNIMQCLDDFGIPLYLKKTVTRVFGKQRLEAAEIMDVDDNMNPIDGTQQIIDCDAVIVSVGLIPENELAESLGIKIDPTTKGPIVDQNMMTSLENVYSVGNALHVHDLVDYVSECSEIAGQHAAKPKTQRNLVDINSKGFLYLVPQRININQLEGQQIFYFRAKKDALVGVFKAYINGNEVKSVTFRGLKPPESQRVSLSLVGLKQSDKIDFVLEYVK